MGLNNVSREQIARAKEISIEDYILNNEPNNVKRIGNAYYLKDHTSLEISNDLWNWHSQDIGGKNVIDYLIKVRGYGFVDAVRRLAGEDISYSRPVTPKARPPTSQRKSAPITEPHAPPGVRGVPDLRLPRRNKDNIRVISYLRSRGIDRNLIQECIRQGNLYESADWHNAVFIGRDEQNRAKFAAIRGTMGGFKRDADGSDKRFGFCLPPKTPQTSTLAVFESPIDALSHRQLFPDFDGYSLSLGGTAPAALTYFLVHHSEIEKIIVCTDNDEAGELAAAKIAELPNIKVERLKSPIGKDWNECLQALQKAVRQQNRSISTKQKRLALP